MRGAASRGRSARGPISPSAAANARPERDLKRTRVVAKLEFRAGDGVPGRCLHRCEELRLLVIRAVRTRTRFHRRGEGPDLDRRRAARVRPVVVVAATRTGDCAGVREVCGQRRAGNDARDGALAVVDAGRDPAGLREAARLGRLELQPDLACGRLSARASRRLRRTSRPSPWRPGMLFRRLSRRDRTPSWSRQGARSSACRHRLCSRPCSRYSLHCPTPFPRRTWRTH